MKVFPLSSFIVQELVNQNTSLLQEFIGVDYNDDELPENVAIRVGMLNGTPKGTYTLLISGTKHVIEGAPGVALYHDKKITLIDKKTKIAFLGAFINGSKKPNVEWVVIEIDGQKIVMFFTNQAIKSGEELFVNYGEDYVIDDPIV
ncbi:unnamed protein product, partial [Mesorhabditis belari]|uniref:SET domain-containing protein n=1 Tax=Mesorhabditis belari TaxID=2138241 RepID=A0AAF3F0A3_9BILA